jgi:hypothetical protein
MAELTSEFVIRHVEENGWRLGCGLDAILPESENEKAATAESKQAAQMHAQVYDLEKKKRKELYKIELAEFIEQNQG